MVQPGERRARGGRLVAWFRDTPEGRSLLRVLGYAIATRVALYALGEFVIRVVHPPLKFHIGRSLSHSTAVAGWMRWDVNWYLSIVDDGYWFDRHAGSNVAFLPGFPAAIGIVSLVLPDTILAGLLVANAAFLGAVAALWSWVRDRAGLKAAERAAILLVLFPLSFFFDTIYSEGLYFVLCTLALKYGDRGNWITAGLFAAGACLTRPTGIFLVPAFAFALLRERRLGHPVIRGATTILLPLAGLGLYAILLWNVFGTPFAVIVAQRVGWQVGNQLNLPVFHKGAGPRQLLDVFEILLPFVLALLSFRAFRRLGTVAGVYALLATAVGVAVGGDSLGREALSVVPVFAAGGLYDPPPPFTTILRAFSFGLLVVFAYGFLTGRFMG